MTKTTRRAVLGALAGATAAGAAACTASRPSPRERPTFVFVGGNGATSFFWMPVVRALSLRGHRSHPVELPWHGLDAEFSLAYQAPQNLDALHRQPSNLSKVTLAEYADAVVGALRKVRAHGPVILVAHSLGGASATLAANLAHDLIDRLVYISAICCTARKSPLDYVLGAENKGSLGLAGTLPSAELSTPKTTMITHTNQRTADRRFHDGSRAATMAEATESQYYATINFCFQPIESASVSLEDARGNPATWGRIPRSYVRLTADRFNTVPNQDRMIADADAATPGNRFDVHDLDSSHLGFVLDADRIAAILDRIAS
ncbi:alpha/beta hydrolase [Amycolatopsis sp. CA-230715]|uniref:alpha/beta hydrolase n=1 Tax=Amycolatopsis sp. CA-230715 TaxID=2745196 RepID=UPI001C03843A|nr:alpha/beta fold hydrolase [Amycolatopsis sp. CA-230715]QWF76732.1 hypothetical protein HUW46_00108 [Amycolatopsis sp. CA-230715]